MSEDLAAIVADISQREPDFYGRGNAPIWCAGEPSLRDIRDLLRVEGILRPSKRMAEFMLANGGWHPKAATR